MAKEEGPRSPDPHLEGVLAGGGTPSLGWGYGGETVGLVTGGGGEGVVLCAFPALPWVGKHLVTVFSDVPVFKVISFLKCNFPTFSRWVTF